MPGKVRWTAGADQMLLLKILETHDLSVDTAKVASAWPGEEDSRPTGRAIKERIAKIKEISKTATLNGLAEPSTPTPKRPRTKVTKASKSPTSARKNRKKNKQASDNDEPSVKAELLNENDDKRLNDQNELNETAEDTELSDNGLQSQVAIEF